MTMLRNIDPMNWIATAVGAYWACSPSGFWERYILAVVIVVMAFNYGVWIGKGGADSPERPN